MANFHYKQQIFKYKLKDVDRFTNSSQTKEEKLIQIQIITKLHQRKLLKNVINF